LRRAAVRLGELGPDGEWLAGVLFEYLDPLGTCTLDEAAGLLPAPGAEQWRTAARRLQRDEAIRALCAYFPGLKRSRIAEKIWKALIGYAATRWKVDCVRSTMPEHYLGTPRAHLYAALVAGDGKVLGESRIRQLLAIGSPLFIASEFDQTAAHGDSTTDHRRPGQNYSTARQERDR
jgi:hypothetical protein